MDFSPKVLLYKFRLAPCFLAGAYCRPNGRGIIGVVLAGVPSRNGKFCTLSVSDLMGGQHSNLKRMTNASDDGRVVAELAVGILSATDLCDLERDPGSQRAANAWPIWRARLASSLCR